MAAFQAIIFDLDGTLLDTLEDLALSVNAVLKRRRFPVHPVEAYRVFVGDGIEMLVKRALPGDGFDAGTTGGVLKAVQEEYRRRWADHTRPYPGVPALLTTLENKGIPKAIFSNKPHEFTVLTVEKLLGRWRFAAVEGARPGVPYKPDPAGVLAIAAHLNLQPREIVYLGDSSTDMLTAVAAGMYPVGAAWGFRGAAELAAAGAKQIARHPEEVAALF